MLAACGSGGFWSSSSGGSAKNRDKSGLLAEPVDSTSQAVAGGIWEDMRTSDPTTLDVIANNSSLSWGEMNLVYSQLAKAGVRSNRPENFEGDAAQSWEIAPDGLTVTFKLRPNVKFDPRPPTSGRVMTSKDVKFSWDFYESKSIGRSNLANSVNPDAPIVSVANPDASTVQVKLAFPY